MLIKGHTVLHTTPAFAQPPSKQQDACFVHALARPTAHWRGTSGHEGLRVRAVPTGAEIRDRLGETSGVVTDQAVPEGHKGLHGFLYGEGGAEAHDSGSQYNFREVLWQYLSHGAP